MGEIRVFYVPPQPYLMIDGQGDPNIDGEYGVAMQGIFPVAYAIKFSAKATSAATSW